MLVSAWPDCADTDAPTLPPFPGRAASEQEWPHHAESAIGRLHQPPGSRTSMYTTHERLDALMTIPAQLHSGRNQSLLISSPDPEGSLLHLARCLTAPGSHRTFSKYAFCTIETACGTIVYQFCRQDVHYTFSFLDL